MDKLEEVKKKYTDQLMQKANVIGVGIGYKENKGMQTDVLCIRVYVRKKVPENLLMPEERIPEYLDGIPTDVISSGDFMAL